MGIDEGGGTDSRPAVDGGLDQTPDQWVLPPKVHVIG